MEVLRRVRQSVARSQPFGKEEWVTTMVEQFGLVSTIRSEGRPKKMFVENVPDTVSVPQGQPEKELANSC